MDLKLGEIASGVSPSTDTNSPIAIFNLLSTLNVKVAKSVLFTCCFHFASSK